MNQTVKTESNENEPMNQKRMNQTVKTKLKHLFRSRSRKKRTSLQCNRFLKFEIEHEVLAM